MTTSPENLQRIPVLLRSSGHARAADDLEQWMAALGSADSAVRAEARNAIIDRTHVRWLGDLYIDGLTIQEWWGALDDLRQYVKKDP